MKDIIDRAAADPKFRRSLTENPFQVARSTGYGGGIDGLRDLLDMRDVDWTDLSNHLQLRLSRLYGGKWI